MPIPAAVLELVTRLDLNRAAYTTKPGCARNSSTLLSPPAVDKYPKPAVHIKTDILSTMGVWWPWWRQCWAPTRDSPQASMNRRKETIKKRWMLNGIYLVITLIAFSLSIFKMDNPVWIAAWIAPIFFIRFMRDNKWVWAVVLGFVVLQAAVLIGLLPLMSMVGTTSIKMDPLFILKWQARSGLLFLAPLFLIPFLLDKALDKHLPRFAGSLVYPSAAVAVELLNSCTTGTSHTFGETQFAITPLVMISSLVGIFGPSFLVAWFGSTINYLWEENWSIKKPGRPGLVCATTMAALLICGGIAIAFPKKAEQNVPIAGITLDYNLFDRMSAIDLNVTEILDLDPAEYTRWMSSPPSHLDEMRQKTLEAAQAGAKIIVWQETALALESSTADAYLQELKTLADQEDVYLLVSYERLLDETEKKAKLMKNVGILFTPEGTVGWEYVKAFPVPGLEEQFSEAGPRNIPYLDTPFGRIGQVICADMLLPHYIRQAAAKDIDLLLVPSLDAISYTPLFAFSSAYRAVENGFTMIRITGDGHSTVIDPYYRQWAGQNSFEQGTANFYVNVPVISRETFYAAVGFSFPYVIVLLLASLIVLAVVKAVKRDKESISTI